MTVSDIFVSVIAQVHNDEKILDAFIDETITVLRMNYTNFELVLIDDGSEDSSVEVIAEKLNQHGCIRLIRLSRKFGEETSIIVGLDSAIGDYVVVLSPNSDPPVIIPKMVELCRNGLGIVIGVRENRAGEPAWLRAGANLFYWYMRKVLGINIPKNSTMFRVFSRQAVNAITNVRDRYRYIRMVSTYVGYPQQAYKYDLINRSGKLRQRTFWQATSTAVDMIVVNSVHPLRVVSALGLIASILNLISILYVILVYLLNPHVAAGWTTTNLENALMFFFVFVILSVLSEYIGRILEESRHRPLYYILEEMNSSVMLANTQRRNITGQFPEKEG